MSFDEGQILVTEKFWHQASPRKFNRQTALQADGNVITVATSMRLNVSPKVTDPVGGMPMDSPNVAGESEHDGQTFCFYHAGCKQQFDQDSQH